MFNGEMVYRLSNAGTVHAVAFRLLHFVETYVSAFPRRKLGLSRKSILETMSSVLMLILLVNRISELSVSYLRSFTWDDIISLLEFNIYIWVFFYRSLWIYFVAFYFLYPIFKLNYYHCYYFEGIWYLYNFCAFWYHVILSKDVFYSN